MSVIDAAELERLLRANSFLTIERPPQLWGLETTDLVSFVQVLGELIAAGLVRSGNELAVLTLNVSNVVDDNDAEYVALTILGPGDWGPEVRWAPGHGVIIGQSLTAAATRAEAAQGYVRDLGERRGSVTLWFSRAGG